MDKLKANRLKAAACAVLEATEALNAALLLETYEAMGGDYEIVISRLQQLQYTIDNIKHDLIRNKPSTRGWKQGEHLYA